MIGPTGVGKTEIARRLAKITGAPFIKVEATKFTEVGYYGRDVESMIRELVENSISMVRKQEQKTVEPKAQQRTDEKLLDLLCGPQPKPSGPSQTSPADAPGMEFFSNMSSMFGQADVILGDAKKEPENQSKTGESGSDSAEDGAGEDANPNETSGQSEEDSSFQQRLDRHNKTREKMLQMLRDGKLEKREVEIQITQKNPPMVLGTMGADNMDMDFQSMIEKIMPKNSKTKKMTVADARKQLFEQECDTLLDSDSINSKAIELVENVGMIFLDEIDKVVAGDARGQDVSRQGVQRDLLPIVEGTTVQTRYWQVKTDHILFFAAGAFHKTRPSDLMPELQGRFPIRVELENLSENDFVRILTEPTSSLTKQYTELLKTEQIDLQFSADGVQTIAHYADRLNQTAQNIGARRLHTLLEKVVEELSFESADMDAQTVTVDKQYVQSKLGDLIEDQDLSRFIL